VISGRIGEINLNITGISSNLLAGLNKQESVAEKGFNFKDMISSEMEKLNSQQVKADSLTQDFISGEVDDLHTVMIATEEARLSLELTVQIRNKVVEAYKEINNMQL